MSIGALFIPCFLHVFQSFGFALAGVCNISYYYTNRPVFPI
jgi:hypothetical protein